MNKIINYAVAVAAAAAATVICLVAAACALHAVLAEPIGQAGASAVVAGIFAVVALVAALLLGRKARGKRALAPQSHESLLTRGIQLARERPFVAAGVGAAAVAVIIRNPSILSALLTAAIAGKAAKPDR